MREPWNWLRLPRTASTILTSSSRTRSRTGCLCSVRRTGQNESSTRMVSSLEGTTSSGTPLSKRKTQFSKKWYHHMGAIPFLRHPIISFTGLFLFGAGIISGWIISAQLKDSWRVGVPENQITELIQEGVYAYIRNPYFLTYYIMYIGLFLVRPSFLFLFLVSAIVIVFHFMVLKEEEYLSKIHGNAYKKYKNRTGRYLPRFG